MLPKKERISRKKFNELFTQSKIFSRGSFFVVKTTAEDGFRAAVVVSKKVAKKATERNRIKRQLYALISAKKRAIPSLSGSYIFLFQKKPLTFADIEVDFQRIPFRS